MTDAPHPRARPWFLRIALGPALWAVYNVDTHHERLWDWRDSELTRELREGPRPREFGLVPW